MRHNIWNCLFKLKMNIFPDIRLYKNECLQHFSKRNIILDNFSVLDLVIRSTSLFKGHRCGGVCVLWMLLVFQFYYFKWCNKSPSNKLVDSKMLLYVAIGDCIVCWEGYNLYQKDKQPLTFTLWFLCSICFLEWLKAFSPQLVDSNIDLDPRPLNQR